MRPRTLKSAAEIGDLEAVKYYLQNGVDVNARTAAGHFPLGGAIIHGHYGVVRFLIQHGADVNLQSVYGWTPLYLAACTGKPGIAAELLRSGACLESRTIPGYNSPHSWTPLLAACANNFVETVQILLSAGAKTDAKDGQGCTALHLAAAHGHLKIVRLLLEVGDNPSARDDEGCTPLYLARTYSYRTVMRFLKPYTMVPEKLEIVATEALVDHVRERGRRAPAIRCGPVLVRKSRTATTKTENRRRR